MKVNICYEDNRRLKYLDYANDCRIDHLFSKESYWSVVYLITKYGVKYFHRRASSETIIYDMFVHLDKKGKVDSKKTLKTIGERIDISLPNHVVGIFILRNQDRKGFPSTLLKLYERGI